MIITWSIFIILSPLFFHCKSCNLIFLKHQESCPKTPWVRNAMDLNLVWNWFWWLRVLIIILNKFYSQRKNIGTKSLFKLGKVPQGMLLNLGVRVLDLKGVYLAHLLVFLSDSKDIILFKGLLTNHFKSSKEFSCGRNLMM